MLFSEIYTPSSQQPQMSEEQMRQARINRWGTDAVGPRDAFSEDYSDKFNTVLSPDDEEKYQAWATENRREKDVYDYDLRGAWKELQSGTMSEDERGHLGDKYKKPNHPTFSDQSIYSGQDGVAGGVWSRNAEGKDVYTPGRKLSSVEADRLRRYFLRNEPGVMLDLKDKVFEERPLPGVNMPLGVFSGLGDTWKGIPAAVLQTASSAITAFKNTGADVLSRMGRDETRAWWEGQKAVMDQAARDIRDYNKVHFEVDPETMGTASQIVYGLFKTLPKAIGYGLAGGVAGGALAFGADVGIDEANRLMDEGVDRDTAINAGLVSFGMNAIGMRLPAVLGASRGMSMAYGAAANAGTNVAEVEGIKFILEHQDYNQLAQQYDLNGVDLAVSAVMGAAFGGAFWRSPEQIRTQKYQDAARLVYEDQQTALFNKGQSQFNFQQAGVQAAINSRAVVALAKNLGIEPDKIRDFSAKIVWSEDGKSAEVPKEAFSMPVTQGKEWHMGPQTIGRENEAVNVVHMNDVPEEGRKVAIDTLTGKLSEGVKNSDSGWVLTGSRGDAKKSLPPFKFAEKNAGLYDAIVQNFEQIVSDAKLIESHADTQHQNPDVRGIHKFAAAASYGGKNYRVQLIVRDYLPSAGGERLATHSIDAVEVEEIGTAGGEGVIAPLAPTDATSVPPGAAQSPGAGVPTAWSSADTVSLSDLLKGFVREDQRGAFDSVDDSYRAEGAAYYEPQEFNQTTGAAKDTVLPGGERTNNRLQAEKELSQKLQQDRGDVLFQHDRGESEIRGSFNPQTNTIKLTPNANLSTFSHEHSHWYLTNLFAHAADKNLSPEARADIDALLKAFGLKSVEEYNALPFEKIVKLQEQYAAWTERYLAEGEVPAGYLQGMFRNFARWLMDMYRDLVGEGAGDYAAKKEIGERYKAQFGEELPELSKEVRRVLDRMYDAEKKMASFRSNSKQVTAARVIQAQRTNNQKVTAPLQNGSAPDHFMAAIRTQQQAAQAMNSGEQVDVSQTMKNVPVNDATVLQAQNAFAKSFQMGDAGTIVVLQNRDRTGAVSVGQMNAIATAPDYTRLSVSRTTDSGAPIVSYGTVPDSQYLGNTETVADGSHKIPMTYAVVEADSVLRSNNFDGTPVPEYGTDPSRMHAIAGNGRMAGLSEAYNRGTAEQYRQDLMADAHSVGINPEVVAGMQRPVLVRIMTPEAVTTGFIERSNSSNVLEKSALETAVQDSPRIRNNVWKYQFDEDGAPTPETARQFTIDIGEPNSLGKLLTADGRPTETATNRLRAAVFYEAYRDRTLTALVADDTDKQGIKRILNAMAAFAPHVINIREASNGAVDLGPILVDVVNRIRNAKIEGTPLESVVGQGDVFGDNPAVQQLLGFIAENQNSAAAIARVLEPFAAAVENRLKSSGNGPQGGLFGEAENVSTDLADVMGIFRDTQNRLISEANAAMRESGATEGFREALPAVDVETMRNTLQALAEAQRPAEKVVESVVETVAEKPAPEATAQAADVETQQQAHQAHEQSVFSENSDRVQVESLSEINPDMVYEWQDDDGNTIQMTARDVLETDAAIDAEANKDMAAMGTAAMCIYRNNGITE
jgi:hypothetical protein|uniref:Crystallin beta/gamma motif-containing protein n=1 Tax=Podoviridae sp. ct9P15 TaxID=2826543 RepID=A0A8S5MFE9_9CAUD|nr:MAG TPA: crystallin beta/gamma motif-containing protein [Podoviridae sp. ct9P15]